MVSFICLYNKGTIKALVSTDIFRAVVASIPLGTINTTAIYTAKVEKDEFQFHKVQLIPTSKPMKMLVKHVSIP